MISGLPYGSAATVIQFVSALGPAVFGVLRRVRRLRGGAGRSVAVHDDRAVVLLPGRRGSLA
jgi:hypothetical protein